ncbi:MAG: hypothetical protein OXC81_04410 [Betaproteobacteria bacterium]|nr:hypothetical protein [Betaproteobacteria bacterium]
MLSRLMGVCCLLGFGNAAADTNNCVYWDSDECRSIMFLAVALGDAEVIDELEAAGVEELDFSSLLHAYFLRLINWL